MVLNVVRLLKGKFRILLLLLACAIFARYYFPFPTRRTAGLDHGGASTSTSTARNETLGFGAIYVLTIDDSTWRVQGLHQAAKLTGLRLRIPVQKRPSEDEVNAYLAGDELSQIPNEVRATLDYLSLIDEFLLTGYETALFLEDDADFGLNVRFQMASIADAILAESVLNREDSDFSEASLSAFTRYPYGKDQWDVFWLGHFGVEFTKDTQVIRYSDRFALPWDRLVSDFNNYYEVNQREQQQQQQIVTHAAPMATYGFALTRSTAQMIVERLRKDRAQKFDLALHILCKGEELRCMAPVPEVIHHHNVVGMKTIRKAGEQSNVKQDLAWWRQKHKFTYNIEWSARCNAAGVGEKLGYRWQCLPGRYDKNE